MTTQEEKIESFLFIWKKKELKKKRFIYNEFLLKN